LKLLKRPLISSEAGPLFGIVMTALFSSFNVLCGLYAHQMQKAGAARRQTQGLIVELQQAHRQLQGYVSQAEEIAAEQERGRLARDLHDSVTQTLFSMNLTAQGASLLFARDPALVPAQLVRLEELAGGAMAEIQALVSHLRPQPAAGEGLPAALRRLAAERSAQNGLQVSVEVSGEGSVSAPAAAGLYAITQEALNNVARHAGTGRATVRLMLDAGRSCLEIADDGPGFDPPVALATPGHLGLTGMTDRAREIGWTLEVDSAQGRGTRILVHEASSTWHRPSGTGGHDHAQN
jgi:signal transduction histidine kinase